MSETVKRYLLPSEIEGVLGQGEHVYISVFSNIYRYQWSRETGVSKYYEIEGHWFESPRSASEILDLPLTSYQCYTLVNLCECGRPLQLNGKCSACDDYFG